MMHSSNTQISEYANSAGKSFHPGFALLVALDFCDGPERGFAVYPSGECVRFSTLGDSRSRLFRSFELATIEGNWWPQIRAFPEAAAQRLRGRMWLPAQDSGMLSSLDNNIFSASPAGHYAGVGSPYLDWLYVSSVTQDQLAALRQLDCSPAGFQSVHQIVKKKRCG